MLILLITQEPPLTPDAVATGNAVRSAQLDGALRRGGHTTFQTWLDTQHSPHKDSFRNRDELQAMITNQRPDAILVAYWELLELLPFEMPQPVILDFVAPRPLEGLYEQPEQVRTELQRLQRNLSKCDLLLVGNEAQRDLLWFTLLQAGFDLRDYEPILVEEVLNPDSVADALLDWLELPAKAPRLPAMQKWPAPVVLGKPPWPQRLKRQAGLLRRVSLRQIFHSRPGKNILIVTRSDLFPDDHGAAVKIVETARALSQHGRKVGIVSDDRNYWWLFEDGQKQRRRLPFWLRLLSLPRSLTRLLHLSKELPESNAFLYLPLTDNSFFWHCLYAGRKLNAGILQAEFPAYAKPCIEAREILNAAVVLVEHNVEYARLKAQVAELTVAQFRNLQAIEIDLCNHSDAVICVSDNDRQQLLSDGVKPELLNTIPHGFDPMPYTLPAKHGLREEFGLPDNAVLMAFHGTFSYPPNRDALQVFAEILLPQLESADLPFHVIAIGRNPPRDDLHPNIHCTGSVDEVGPWLKACDMAVIPLREGGGTRMKIIDCFAAGLAVVSTGKGIEGIPVINQREAVITDDWASMLNAIIDLAGSRQRRDKLSAAAQEFAAEMDWKSITRRYLSIFSAIQRTVK